jgi:hypothetical protein
MISVFPIASGSVICIIDALPCFSVGYMSFHPVAAFSILILLIFAQAYHSARVTFFCCKIFVALFRDE